MPLADEAPDGENPIVKRKKKLDENFYGIVHIQSTFNNTIVNITDVAGATLCW
jgi:small subunit ribosomal protein S11